ncbi:MAG: flotillin-like protein FloA [Planctomycetaceae bacterium]|nr:flotillin-like protein FloA [Planctomycetaceae bacterium]MCA9029510.1 flotillin-like protein FloA [Planctomycetaceae bacterium]MCA9044233.1 flotillin-like protein FloA [Planctomycetaceae bacterium]MCB9950811.1 flotillin-like protein FloA [Planctomycetaceae bacterium]
MVPYVIGGIFFAIIGLVVLALLARYIGLYIQCYFSKAGINLIDLVVMSIRNVNPAVIVRAKIMAVQSGVTDSYDVTNQALQAHYLAGGNVLNVVKALVAAHRAGIDMDWQVAQAIDLAGRDLLDAVKTSVNPRVIDCPDPRKTIGTLDALAGDGVQLKARARVTVRTNIQQLIGGATEETIIARVGQGIVQAIGSTPSYKLVLENPDMISQTVLNQGLEANTAFEIVSIDIADIDVGENVGARLSADQAEADMRVAQARAEQRRAAAIAREQEMIAASQRNRAEVVLAEASVPMAIVEGFRDGKIGLMDYYNLKNVQADTSMRAAIAGVGDQVAPNVDV